MENTPLLAREKECLANRLSSSTLITKVVSLLKINNPLLQTTDWNEVVKAMKEYTLKFWRDIKSKTPNINAYERGGQVLSKVGFSGWKLQCQVVTSRECKKPEKAPNTYRNQCPGCHKHHHNFAPCLKKLNCYRKNCINNRSQL